VGVDISAFISGWPHAPFFRAGCAPWELTASAPDILDQAIAALSGDYDIRGNIAAHRSAIIEAGAVLKGPVIVGPGAFVAATAYLRGGVFLDAGCIVGPGCEVKSAFLFAEAKIAHLSFVGDSILGSGVNIEAGAMLANYRNEMDDKHIRIVHEAQILETGVDKFGALVGDGVKIGANVVIAPGALIPPGLRIPRLSLIDQHPARSRDCGSGA
jgi:NDP-sugar pyrophosphorylase family protein